MKPIQVSQLNQYIRTVFLHEPLLSHVPVIGEISNLKYHSSGHVYFALKDATSRVSCFLPRDRVEGLRYVLEEGMEIIAEGNVDVYERGGYYSLNVRSIRVEGAGNLMLAFEKLKKTLEQRGWFATERKRSLPLFPERIGLVTSETGAAVRDMLRTIRNKNACVEIVLCPCRVQGEGAAVEIAESIEAMNQMPTPPDVLIVGRGGGSMEDLWPFNEEVVAKAIVESAIPVVSAVGHETDVTIADFVADVRAATPTAAAELAAPSIAELRYTITQWLRQGQTAMRRRIEEGSVKVEASSPERLKKELRRLWQERASRVEQIMQGLLRRFQQRIHEEELRLERLKSVAEGMNPYRILQRGYGLVTHPSGSVVRSVEELNPGENIQVRIRDGVIHAVVDQLERKGEANGGEKSL